MLVIYIITIPPYHMTNSSSGTLWPNKTWRSSLPHWPSLPEVTLITFGTLNVQDKKSYNIPEHTAFVYLSSFVRLFDVSTFDPGLPRSPILPGFPSGPYHEKK